MGPKYLLKDLPATLLISFGIVSAQFQVQLVQAASSSSATSEKVYTWYDGDRRMKVQLNPELLAEFDSGESMSRRSIVQGVLPKAKLESKEDERVRIWKLPRQMSSLSAIRKVEKENVRDRKEAPSNGRMLSPIFEEGENGGGRRRALPGNIIVNLNPQWSESKIQKWISNHGLKVIKRMENNPHTLLVESPPGLASLRIANRLHESGEVVSASPNWWKESVLK